MNNNNNFSIQQLVTYLLDWVTKRWHHIHHSHIKSTTVWCDISTAQNSSYTVRQELTSEAYIN